MLPEAATRTLKAALLVNPMLSNGIIQER